MQDRFSSELLLEPIKRKLIIADVMAIVQVQDRSLLDHLWLINQYVNHKSLAWQRSRLPKDRWLLVKAWTSVLRCVIAAPGQQQKWPSFI